MLHAAGGGGESVSARGRETEVAAMSRAVRKTSAPCRRLRLSRDHLFRIGANMASSSDPTLPASCFGDLPTSFRRIGARITHLGI